MSAGQGFDDDEEPFGGAWPGEQLTLTDDDDERLPWLETGDDDEPARGFDTARLIAFALIAVLVLVAILAAIWWFSNRQTGSELQPRGSVIAAPETPYKVKPEHEGGKVFEGTGDMSFEVGEGKMREGKLDAKPAPEPTQSASPDPVPSQTPEAKPTPQETGVNVQVGAYATKAAAQNGWVTLQRQTDKLNGVRHRIVRGQADIGIVYRLQALPGDLAAAKALCAALKQDGVPCTVKR